MLYREGYVLGMPKIMTTPMKVTVALEQPLHYEVVMFELYPVVAPGFGC